MEKHITKTTVLSRDGWTESGIKLFLPIPDKEVANPNYRKAAPMKLYNENRVVQIENSDEFKAFKEKSSSRKNDAQKAVKTKTSKILQYVNNLVIDVPVLSKEELIEKSCEHFNYRVELKQEKYDDLWWRKGREESKEEGFYEQLEFQKASKNSDPAFLERICTNYLRHCLTHYERELHNLFGKVGKGKAYPILKAKVNRAIFDTYTWIKYREDEEEDDQDF